MIVGVPKEIKSREHRVSMLPVGVEMLTRRSHQVLIQENAGLASSFDDAAYRAAGGEIVRDAADVFTRADLVVKVKEPLASEFPLMRDGQIMFTYFHFAASEDLTRAVAESHSIAIAYETVETPDGHLPLLTPMSEVAGRMAVHQAAKYLEAEFGGRGILLGGVPGVEPATVLILGGGVVGANAARMAAGLGARVYLLDINLERLRYLSDVMPSNVITMMSNPHNVRDLLERADAVISAVLVHGSKAPKLIRREHLKLMKRGAVIVDVAIDQGGSLETSKPTTHTDPVYVVDGILHYCVANMPGAMPLTSTIALTNATLPYILELADKGCKQALTDNPALRAGANIVRGHITYPQVAATFNFPYTPLDDVLRQL